MNPFKKCLISEEYGVKIVERTPLLSVENAFEPTPETARKLLQDYFFMGALATHDKEVVALAFTSPAGASRIYGDRW